MKKLLNVAYKEKTGYEHVSSYSATQKDYFW